jgi:hypothetical protein
MRTNLIHHDDQIYFFGRNSKDLIFQFVVFCVLTIFPWKVVLADGAVIWGFEPSEMAAAYRSPTDVVGDLGGMPVKISRHVAEYVEYDGDPGFSGPPRHGPPPERTYASRLKSFGFDVRFPDMAMLTTREMVVDKANHNIYNTPWMSIGISSGEIYPGRGFMNRLTVIEKIENRYWWNDYEELPKKIFRFDRIPIERNESENRSTSERGSRCQSNLSIFR